MTSIATSKTKLYKQLVIAVRTIDRKAASYLNGKQIQELPSFSIQSPSDNYKTPSQLLEVLFIWQESKQGHSFWLEIFKQLVASEQEGV